MTTSESLQWTFIIVVLSLSVIVLIITFFLGRWYESKRRDKIAAQTVRSIIIRNKPISQPIDYPQRDYYPLSKMEEKDG